MHILPQNQDPLAAHRELQRQLLAGELTPSEYRAAFRTVDDAGSLRVMCANGDDRLATANVGGRPLCSACWLIARGKRGRA